MTERRDSPASAAATRKALKALFELGVPEFDMEKINAMLREHDRTCGLCKLIFGERRGR